MSLFAAITRHSWIDFTKILVATAATVCTGMAVAYPLHTAESTTGNASPAGVAVGLRFNVAAGYTLSLNLLGVYDSGNDGTINAGANKPLSTYLYDSSGAKLVSATFDSAHNSSYLYHDGYAWFDIADMILGAGTYTLVSYGFDSADPYHDASVSGSGDTFFRVEGVTFVDSLSGIASPQSIPGFASAADIYSGPNIDFICKNPTDRPCNIPEPSSIGLALLGLAALGVRRRVRV